MNFYHIVSKSGYNPKPCVPMFLNVLFSLIPQATVLEEMPPFPERESSILAKLKKKKGPGAVSVTELEDSKRESGELNGGGDTAAMAASNAVSRLYVDCLALHFCPLALFSFVLQSTPSPSADLLGIRSAAPIGSAPTSTGSLLVDVFCEAGPTAVNDDGFLR